MTLDNQKSSSLQSWASRMDWFRAIILAIAFLMLFLFLDWKPPQHDEGVNGWMVQDLLAKGYYPYDPANYHGPLHFYILFLFRILFGDNLWGLRLSAVLFSWASIYLVTQLRPYFGKFCAYGAALLISVSPGMTFYSRYAIHESELLFFSILTLLGFCRFSNFRDKKALWMLGLGFAGMIVTKETYVISAGCMAMAWILLKVLERAFPSTEQPDRIAPSGSNPGITDYIEVFAVSGFLIVLLYSGFFLYWKGVEGLFTTFADWFNTGALPTSEQKGHWKDLLYWAQLFFRYEWPAALGILLCFPLIGEGPRWHRLVMLYAVLLLGVYSAIPYKTPWCILQLIWPFLIVTASGLSALAQRSIRHAQLAFGLLCLLAMLSGGRAIILNFFHYADDREPYVHVQTFESLMSVDRRLKELVRRDPVQRHMTIHVVKKAYWPISWLLVDFTHHDYYTEELPPKADAGVLFVDGERRKRLEMRLTKSYFVEKFRLNPAQDPGYVFYDYEIFKNSFGADAEIFKPEPMPEAEPGQGLKAVFYKNTLWQGDAVKEMVMTGPEFVWESGETPVPPPFGVVLSGKIFVPVSGEVQFFLSSDDGSDLTVGGDILINNLGDHSERMKSKSFSVEAGWHPIRIRFYDVGGSASLRLWWKLPSGNEERIIPKNLKPGDYEAAA